MNVFRVNLLLLLLVASATAVLGQTPEREGNTAAPASGAGGGAFADFDSLIGLIETIVAPETWETLGGPSSIQPYPQGVYVDTAGTLQECAEIARDDVVDDLQAALAAGDRGLPDDWAAWRRPSQLRFVSLRRLHDLRSDYEQRSLPIPESMFHLAGLSQIDYVFCSDDDIVIAGPVAGIETHHGWYRQRTSGRVPIRFDFLVAGLSSALTRQPFGCTIDPTADGLQSAAQVAMEFQQQALPLGIAARSLAAALGRQRIEVFGTAGDRPLGYVMVEADRHMKQLALGIVPSPPGVKTYLDVIDETMDLGPPQDLLLRLWFTAQRRAVRVNDERTVFQLGGSPIRLSGQNERARADGQRGELIRDPRSETFVQSFNDHFAEIRLAFPIYAALESIYQAAAVAELLHRHCDQPHHRELLESLTHFDSCSRYLMPTPLQVESLAVLHTSRSGNQRHHILIASGGVLVHPTHALAADLAEYSPLDSLTPPESGRPRVIQRWWWDRDH